MRIYELASILSKSTDEVMQSLRELAPELFLKGNISPMTSLGDSLLSLLEEKLLGKKKVSVNQAIERIQVSNFKAFGSSENSVPIRPLTIVFGPNSSGKSSFLHSLLFSHHCLKTGDGDVRQPLLGGESVDLGGFQQFCHRHETSNSPTLDLQIKSPRLSRLLHANQAEDAIVVSLVFRDPKNISFLDSIDLEMGSTGRALPRRNLAPGKESNPWLRDFTCQVGAKALFQFGRGPNGSLGIYTADFEHPFFATSIEAAASSIRISATENNTTLRGDIQSLFNRFLLESSVEEEKFLPKALIPSPDFFTRIEPADENSLTLEDMQQLPPVLEGILAQFSKMLGLLHSTLHSYFSSFCYLGPLRSYPERYFSFSSQREANWQAGGGFAWDVLRHDKETRDKINQWLGNPDRLNTPYRIGIRRYIDPTAGSEEIEEILWEGPNALIGLLESSPMAEIKDSIEQTSYVDVRSQAEEVIDRLKQSTKVSGVNDLQMMDLRTNTVVSHRDVGVGISQVLPVLVLAMASEEKNLLIEQPEIHIHPKLQAELGDVFIQSALGPQQNNLLIETHSEHLILRILRRVRECSERDKDYPSDLPKIKPQDISVLYVQPTPEGSVIQELRVTPDGDFADKWPEGFFTERFSEYP